MKKRYMDYFETNNRHFRTKLFELYLKIPNGVKEIGDGCFDLEEPFIIRDIRLPEGLKKIDRRAFATYQGYELNIPESVEFIGEEAFYNSKINRVVIPGRVKKLPERAFSECHKLETVELNNGTETIGFRTFSNCVNLKKINLPSSMTEIGDYAFCGCKSLMEIKIPDSVKKIGWGAFFDCENLINVIIPDGCEVEKYSFYDYWERKGLCVCCGSELDEKGFCEQCNER